MAGASKAWNEVIKPKFSLNSRDAIKLALILMPNFIGAHLYVDRVAQFSDAVGVSQLTTIFKIVAWACQFLFFTAMLVLAGNVNNRTMRWTLAALLSVGAAFTLSYRIINAEDLSFFSFVTMLDSRSALADVIDSYAQALMIAALGALMVALGIGLAPSAKHRWPQWLCAGAPVAGYIVLSTVLFVRNGEGAAALPPSWASLAYMPLYVSALREGRAGARQPVSIAPTGRRPAADIVVIVDESISGNYLDINGPQGVRSGLLEPRPGVAVHNFGLAASIANCSVQSNVTLRFGGTRDDYQRIIGSMPSIWSYAKASGMRTVMLYAQRKGSYENYMTEEERKDIDQMTWFEGVDAMHRDQAVAAKLVGLLNNDKAEFIYVNKVGAHFPLRDAYPTSHEYYKPTLLHKQGWLDEVDNDRNRRLVVGQQGDWTRYRNSYRNTLTWTVGTFFDTLLAGAKLGDATIIYTSDHGQTLHERGKPGLTTHCQSTPEIEEGVVPLVVIRSNTAKGLDWKAAAAAGRNKMSHYRIFPTLLSLMGYQEVDVERIYGYSLTQPQRDPMTFSVGMQIKFNSHPKWIHIPVDQVIQPPASDFAEPIGAAKSGALTIKASPADGAIMR